MRGQSEQARNWTNRSQLNRLAVPAEKLWVFQENTIGLSGVFNVTDAKSYEVNHLANRLANDVTPTRADDTGVTHAVHVRDA